MMDAKPAATPPAPRRSGTPIAFVSLFALLTILCGTRGDARAAEPRRRLSLPYAMELAMNIAPSARLERARAEATHARIGVAQAAYFPTVSLVGSARLDHVDEPQFGPDYRDPPPPFVTTVSRFGLDLNVTIPIVDFGRRANDLRAAEQSWRESWNTSRSTRLQNAYNAAELYLNSVTALEQVDVLRRAVLRREAELRSVSMLVERGVRALFDEKRAKFQLDAARSALAGAEQTARSGRVDLVVAIGLDPVTDADLAPVDDATIAVDTDPVRAANQAVAIHPEVAASRARLAQAEAAAASARAQLLPELDFQGSASVSRTDPFQDAASIVLVPGPRSNERAGLTLGWNSLSVGSFRNASVAAKNLATQRAELESTVLTVRGRAARLAFNVRTADTASDRADALAAAAADNLQVEQGRFRAGIALLIELLDAEQQSLSSEIDQLNAHLARRVARVRLLFALGQVRGGLSPVNP